MVHSFSYQNNNKWISIGINKVITGRLQIAWNYSNKWYLYDSDYLQRSMFARMRDRSVGAIDQSINTKHLSRKNSRLWNSQQQSTCPLYSLTERNVSWWTLNLIFQLCFLKLQHNIMVRGVITVMCCYLTRLFVVRFILPTYLSVLSLISSLQSSKGYLR